MNEKKTYQVWHDIGWPQSRINQMFGDQLPPRFPDGYVHVANVKADGLKHAVALTTDQGNFLAGHAIPWEANPAVESFFRINRDTDAGDVIVTPSGRPYRLEGDVFRDVEAYERILDLYALRGEDGYEQEQDRGMDR